MIDHATTSAPVFFGTHALHSEHQFTSLVLNNYRDKVVEVKSSHYDRIQPNNRPIDDPLIQLEAKGTHAITPERMGSPYDQLSMANEYFMKSHILWPVSQRPLSA